MWPNKVLNPRPPALESDALQPAPRGPALVTSVSEETQIIPSYGNLTQARMIMVAKNKFMQISSKI